MNVPRRLALALALFAVGCDHQAPTTGSSNSFGSPGTVGNAAGTPGAGPTTPGTPTSPTAGSSAMGRASAGAAGSPGTTGPGTAPAAGSGTTPAGMNPGTTAQGGAMAAAGGAGAAPTTGGGYVVSGNWKGYAWTGATGMGSTIMPKDFAGLAAGAPFCAMGTVAADPMYGVGMLGINLNQAATMDAPLMTATPTGTGVMVDMTNMGSSILRIQIQTPDGDADHRWCAPVSGKGGMMPWSSFNTKCWDNSGTAYAGEPISTLMVLVPGTTTDAVPFNFCLNSVSEVGATMMPPASGAAGMSGAMGMAGSPAMSGNPGMGSGMLSGGYDWHDVTKDGHNYIVQNNVWGGGGASQTVKYDGTSFEITQRSGDNPTTGQPGSYPSIFIGSNNGHSSSGSNLPKQVSALSSVQTSWSNNAGSAIAGTYNAAYDVWFSTGAGGDSGAPSGGYLMVWLYKNGVQPLGNSIAQSGATIAGVEGTWDVWVGQQLGHPCISYVRSQATTSLSFDLNKFIQDAVKRPEKPIQSSWYLTNVFAGFEIWSGGNGLKTNDFSAVVQ